MHPLDLDLIRNLGDRARAMFDVVTLRVYTAALIGRLRQRMPYGGHSRIPLPVNVPIRVAHNDSRERALLVYVDVDGLVPTPIVYSPTDSSGSVNFEALQSQLPGAFPETFVLRPDEQLFARGLAGATAIVATEWY